MAYSLPETFVSSAPFPFTGYLCTLYSVYSVFSLSPAVAHACLLKPERYLLLPPHLENLQSYCQLHVLLQTVPLTSALSPHTSISLTAFRTWRQTAKQGPDIVRSDLPEHVFFRSQCASLQLYPWWQEKLLQEQSQTWLTYKKGSIGIYEELMIQKWMRGSLTGHRNLSLCGQIKWWLLHSQSCGSKQGLSLCAS